MEQKQGLSQPTDQQDLAVTRRSMLTQTGTVAIALFGLRFLPVNPGDDGSDLQAASDRSEREQFLHWVGEHMLAGARQQMTREDGADHV